MTADKLYSSLTANTIVGKLASHLPLTRLITPSTDKHHSFGSEDDFRSSYRNIIHQQQLFFELRTTNKLL